MTPKMNRDPVVDEVRQIRDAYAHQFDYDLDAICDDLKRREKNCSARIVSVPPKRIPAAKPHPLAS